MAGTSIPGAGEAGRAELGVGCGWSAFGVSLPLLDNLAAKLAPIPSPLLCETLPKGVAWAGVGRPSVPEGFRRYNKHCTEAALHSTVPLARPPTPPHPGLGSSVLLRAGVGVGQGLGPGRTDPRTHVPPGFGLLEDPRECALYAPRETRQPEDRGSFLPAVGASRQGWSLLVQSPWIRNFITNRVSVPTGLLTAGTVSREHVPWHPVSESC